MKNETKQKRGHLVRKMTVEKKETANDAHGGCVTEKRHKQAKRGTKRPICRRHAHRVRRVTHSPPPGPISLCSVSQMELDLFDQIFPDVVEAQGHGSTGSK
jgi:hypothetical protein